MTVSTWKVTATETWKSPRSQALLILQIGKLTPRAEILLTWVTAWAGRRESQIPDQSVCEGRDRAGSSTDVSPAPSTVLGT